MRKIIIYFLNRKRDVADKVFYKLVGKELLVNNPIERLVRSQGVIGLDLQMEH